VTHSLSVELPARGRTIGALNLSTSTGQPPVRRAPGSRAPSLGSPASFSPRRPLRRRRQPVAAGPAVARGSQPGAELSDGAAPLQPRRSLCRAASDVRAPRRQGPTGGSGHRGPDNLLTLDHVPVAERSPQAGTYAASRTRQLSQCGGRHRPGVSLGFGRDRRGEHASRPSCGARSPTVVWGGGDRSAPLPSRQGGREVRFPLLLV
jgi:hypothetical protein